MRNVSDKSCRENQNTHFVFGNLFINHAVNEKMWKNVVERDGRQMKIWCMRFVCWIPKATGTHAEYVIFIVFSSTMVNRKQLNIVTAFFWAVTQRVVVIPDRRFGTTCRSHIQGSRIWDW